MRSRAPDGYSPLAHLSVVAVLSFLLIVPFLVNNNLLSDPPRAVSRSHRHSAEDLKARHASTDSLIILGENHVVTGVDSFRDCRVRNYRQLTRRRQFVLSTRSHIVHQPIFANNSPATPYLLLYFDSHLDNREVIRNSSANDSNHRLVEQFFVLACNKSETKSGDESAIFNDILCFDSRYISTYLSLLVAAITWVKDEFPDQELLIMFLQSPLMPDTNRLYSHFASHDLQLSESIYGGERCLDYQDSEVSWDNLREFPCSTDALFCTGMQFLTGHLLRAIEPVTWHLPLALAPDRYLGLAVELADEPHSTVILDRYLVGNSIYSHTSHNFSWFL